MESSMLSHVAQPQTAFPIRILTDGFYPDAMLRCPLSAIQQRHDKSFVYLIFASLAR
jgi:hypothetical protein